MKSNKQISLDSIQGLEDIQDSAAESCSGGTGPRIDLDPRRLGGFITGLTTSVIGGVLSSLPIRRY